MNKYHIRFNHQHNGLGKVCRDVDYLIEEETFDDETQAISATAIRKQMGIQ